MALKNVRFDFPRSGYKRLMPFNRFAVERIDSLVIIHFGLVNNSGLLLDRYSIGIFQVELDALKENLMDYLGKTGSLAEPPPTWQPPSGINQVEVFNHVGVTSNPDVAETSLNNLVVRGLHEARQTTGGAVPIDPVVLLRSTLEVQKHLIRELYPLK
jgi:hypothetical protein